jgi:beta-N-acetylhexosaminidase
MIKNRPQRLAILTALITVVGLAAGGFALHQAPSNSPRQSSRVSTLIDHMTLRQKVGQMFMISLSGTSLSKSQKKMLKATEPGGITLFGDNFSSTSQLTKLDAALQRHAHIPLFISVDQEGGEVIRITSGVKQLQSEQAYGTQNNPAQLHKDTSTEAKQLKPLGINMNLAPVLDVATNPKSIMASEQRSFGPHAGRDAKLGMAEINGYQHHGIAATAKHVIGLGTTTVDPESTLPRLNLSAAQMKTQLKPFKAAVKDKVDAIMVTHVVLDGITGKNTPASLSRKVVTNILRNQLGYDGVIMTDSLSMGAVSSLYTVPTACVMGVHAGEDILLVADESDSANGTVQTAINQVISDVHAGSITKQRINKSVKRILALKAKLGLPLPTT